jgi:hypothetical protein
MNRSSLLALAFVFAFGLVGPAFAQAPAPSDSLSGPKVVEKEPAPSLVKRGFDGRLERVVQPVEEAAVAVLPLSEEERAMASEVILRRAAIIDKGIRESVPVLLRIQGIREEGITPDRQAAIRELDKKLPMLRDREEFRSALRGAMSTEHAAMFDAVVNEYSRAAIADASATAKAEGRKGNPFAMSVGESLRNVGVEIQQSYDRVIADGTRRLDRAMEIIQPTPEQEGKLRNLATEFGQKTLANPTPIQRAQFVREFMKLLTHEQRQRVATEFFASQGEQPDTTSNPPTTRDNAPRVQPEKK